MVWISGVVDLAPPETAPTIRFESPEAIHAVVHPDVEFQAGRLGLAYYDAVVHEVVLPTQWDLRNPFHLSMLVHELVHHMQDASEAAYPCPAAKEREAYDAQQAWLLSQGLNLFDNDVIRINELFYVFATTCHAQLD
jgi:hypothetical protein